MFGVSLPELIIVFVVALVVLGPEKLPEIARMLGKLTGEFRKHSNELRREFYNSVYTPSNDLRTRIGTEVQQLRSVTNLSTPPTQPQVRTDTCESSTAVPGAQQSPSTAPSATGIEKSTENTHVEEKKH